MSEAQTFRRFPAIRCWIGHILEGKYSNNDKSLYTIFGQIKRIRVAATIIDKKEIINNQNLIEDDPLDDNSSNIRVEFHLDDGTGVIRATLWSVNPEDYMQFSKGDKIDIIGLIRNWKGYTSISPEIIKKIDDPNFALLCDLEIIKQIKEGDIKDIPEIEDDVFEISNHINEINVDSLFHENNSKELDFKEELYLTIEEHTLQGEGVSFQELKNLLNINKEDLKNLLKDLEIESKIYQSDDNIYQSY